jgi:hypothetical protein
MTPTDASLTLPWRAVEGQLRRLAFYPSRIPVSPACVPDIGWFSQASCHESSSVRLQRSLRSSFHGMARHETPTTRPTPNEVYVMMTPLSVRRSILLPSALLLTSTLSPFSASAADGQVKGAVIPAPAPKIASGAVEDSLKACLARIPEKASVGQRMLAERTCQGEDGTRKL